MATSVSFNIDVNKLLDEIFSRSKRNDLMVVIKNGTTRNSQVQYSVDPGGHGNIAQIHGSPDLSPIDLNLESQNAPIFGVGVRAAGAGSNILLIIPFAGGVLNVICAAPVNKENYIKYSVTEKVHTAKPMRDRVDKGNKHYANAGNIKAKVGHGTSWFSITNVSPAVCQIELREDNDLIRYA
jgi:hypothetical protein